MATSTAGTFSGRVAVMFATQIFGAGLGIINGIILARLLGPTLKGDYYLLVLLPSTLMVLLQLGLPVAFGYFSARLENAGIVTKAMVLTTVLTTVAFFIVVFFLPFFESAFLHGLPLDQVLFAFLAFPLALNATFTSSIVMGRQGVKWYAVVNSAYPVVTTVLLIIVLGGIGPSVIGAIAVYLVASLVQAAGFAIGASQLSAGPGTRRRIGYGALFRYALPFYPGSLTQFFSARADAFLLAWLIVDPFAQLGYYSLAVGLAEMVFFFPNAVAILFFPHVAGSTREDSDRQVPMVSRVALLVTAFVGVLLVPAAIVMIRVFLPAFEPALPALFVILPGVVTLSVTKVVAGYMLGIGRPAINSWINIVAFVVNIVANLFLIPMFGIVGASAASLISYTLSAVLSSVIAAHLGHQRTLDFWMPRSSDIRFTATMSVSVARRLVRALPGSA